MTVITHNRRKSRLSKIIDQAGGVSVGVALADARANLEALRPRSLQEIGLLVNQLTTVVKPEPGQEAEELRKIYYVANGIIDAAGPFDLGQLCAAAGGLCDLIDATTPQHPFDWRVVPVYAQSLQLLIALPGDATDARAKVCKSLEEMVERMLGPAA